MERRESRERRIEGTSRLGTLLGVLLLLAVGFFFGLVTGAVWQEPRLVASFVSGHTTDVVLSDIELEARIPSLALGEPDPGGRPLGGPRDAQGLGLEGADLPSRTPQPAERPVVSAPPPRSQPQDRPRRAEQKELREGFSIQVGAFGERRAADALAGTLRAVGLPVYVISGDGAARWRVRVGPLGSREEAERLSRRIQAKHELPTWILAEQTP